MPEKRKHVYPIFEIIDQTMSHLQMGQRHQVEFETLWDIDSYFKEELEQHQDFAPVLTLSGTMNNAYATTCAEYIRRFWSDSSADVLDELLPAVKQLLIPGTHSTGFPYPLRSLNFLWNIA